MPFMCFSNVKIKAFIKRIWNTLNKLRFVSGALTEELTNFKAKAELNRKQDIYS